MVFRIYFLDFLDVIRKKYAQFSGRARRSEYWFFMIFKWAIILTLVQLSELAEQGTLAFTALAGMSVLFFIALIIPSLAVSVRRLHDTGNFWMDISIRYDSTIGRTYFTDFLFSRQ